MADMAKMMLLSGARFEGSYHDFSSGEPLTITAGDELEMPPWSYRVLTR
jgi:hypothetical protein